MPSSEFQQTHRPGVRYRRLRCELRCSRDKRTNPATTHMIIMRRRRRSLRPARSPFQDGHDILDQACLRSMVATPPAVQPVSTALWGLRSLSMALSTSASVLSSAGLSIESHEARVICSTGRLRIASLPP